MCLRLPSETITKDSQVQSKDVRKFQECHYSPLTLAFWPFLACSCLRTLYLSMPFAGDVWSLRFPMAGSVPFFKVLPSYLDQPICNTLSQPLALPHPFPALFHLPSPILLICFLSVSFLQKVRSMRMEIFKCHSLLLLQSQDYHTRGTPQTLAEWLLNSYSKNDQNPHISEKQVVTFLLSISQSRNVSGMG